jgi:hypothetical protein
MLSGKGCGNAETNVRLTSINSLLKKYFLIFKQVFLSNYLAQNGEISIQLNQTKNFLFDPKVLFLNKKDLN